MPKENLWQSQQTVSKTIPREPPPKRGFTEILIQAFNDNPPLSLNAFCVCRQREPASAADWDKGGTAEEYGETNYNTTLLTKYHFQSEMSNKIVAYLKFLCKNVQYRWQEIKIKI